ncbi:MAG: glutamyl-tRNA reductase [Proteobacteria bacterium]|nr:glutamyl-tRNA reductase [Pseudomonadota bacterium]MBU1648629.1 glutamyl-tRNA reductase [Pseudomonadota bacterium]MBU1985871.1 glutamyl-tRNA reductase [Pseudomonadota bacterium]
MPSDMILLLGVNHKTTPLAVREQLALGNGYEQPLHALRGIAGCKECYLLSTCNRVEILVVAQEDAQVEAHIARLLFGDSVAPEKHQDYLYIYRNDAAIHHLFMVSTSLDSMIVGEAQILGQLKEAYRHAAELKCTGPVLNKLLHKSFSVAKRVRSETLIGASAVSISYAAVELAKKIFGNLQDKNVLLIGAGEMAELAAEHLVGQGVRKVVVANRTLSRAMDLAKRFNGSAVSLDELFSQLEQADIVISSTGAPNIILHKQDVKPIMRARRNEPIFFIDIAVPRDLDPELNDLDNVYLYDIDDLHNVVEINKSERDKEAIKARRIVDEEALKFLSWLDNLSVVPTIAALRKKADTICQVELERTLCRLQLSPEEQKAIEKMALAISSRLLHDPVSFLKNDSCKEQHDIKVEMIRAAFNLMDKN